MILLYAITIGLIIVEVLFKLIIKIILPSSNPLVLFNGGVTIGFFKNNLSNFSNAGFEIVIFIFTILLLVLFGYLTTKIKKTEPLLTISIAFMIAFTFTRGLDMLFYQGFISYIKLGNIYISIIDLIAISIPVLIIIWFIKKKRSV